MLLRSNITMPSKCEVTEEQDVTSTMMIISTHDSEELPYQMLFLVVFGPSWILAVQNQVSATRSYTHMGS